MSTAGEDRLNAIKDELDGVLSERIGELMGLVRASRELVAQITLLDQQLSHGELLRDTAQQQGATGEGQEMERGLAGKRLLRDRLVDRLASISASTR